MRHNFPVTMNLLKHSTGNMSLEFAPGDLTEVCRAIDEIYGGCLVEQCVTYQRWTFGSETFLFENEWGQPCLIAQSPQGMAMLRDMADVLAA